MKMTRLNKKELSERVAAVKELSGIPINLTHECGKYRLEILRTPDERRFLMYGTASEIWWYLRGMEDCSTERRHLPVEVLRETPCIIPVHPTDTIVYNYTKTNA